MWQLRHPSPRLALPLAALLLLVSASRSQLDPVACKAAKKELAVVTKSAAYEHRVHLFDAAVNFAFTMAFPLVDAQMGVFVQDDLEGVRNALDGFARDLQESTLDVSGIVANQIPQILNQAFGGVLAGVYLPPGFLPGDHGVLDDFHDKLARQQARLVKGLDKVRGKVASGLRKFAGVELNWIVVPPDIAWAAGNGSGALVRAPRLEPLDVLVAARGGAIGTSVALAGWADEAQGEVLVQLLGTDGVVHDSRNILPQVDRWNATFADVSVNPVIVRVSRGGATLAERVIGIP